MHDRSFGEGDAVDHLMAVAAFVGDPLDVEPAFVRAREHHVAVGLFAAADDQARVDPGLVQVGERVDRLQPILIGIEAADFHERRTARERLLHLGDELRIGTAQEFVIDAVRDHERGNAAQREFELHVLADGRDRRGTLQCREIDILMPPAARIAVMRC